MAINKTFDEEEDKGVGAQDEEQDINALKAPVPAGTAPTGGGQAIGTAPKPTSSGSFTNLQKFISANKPKIQRQGQQTTERLGGAAETAKSGFKEAESSISESIKGSTLEDTSTYTKDDTGKDIGLTGVIGKEGWEQYVPGNEAWTGIEDTDIDTSIDPARQDVKKTVGDVQGTTTQGGLASAIQSGKEGNYNRGMSNLNAALMGRGKETQAALGALRDKYKGTVEDVNKRSLGLYENLYDAKDANLQTQKDFRDWYTGKGTALESDLDKAASSRTTGDAAREFATERQGLIDQGTEIAKEETYNNVSNVVNEKFPQGTLQKLGITKDTPVTESIDRLYNDSIERITAALKPNWSANKSQWDNRSFEDVLQNDIMPGERAKIEGYFTGGDIDPTDLASFSEASIGRNTGTKYTKGAGATPEQKAAYEALSKIYGQTDSTLPFDANFDQELDFYTPDNTYESRLRQYIQDKWNK